MIVLWKPEGKCWSLASQVCRLRKLVGKCEFRVWNLRPRSGIVLDIDLFFRQVDVERKQKFFGKINTVKEDNGDVVGAPWSVFQHPLDALADVHAGKMAAKRRFLDLNRFSDIKFVVIKLQENTHGRLFAETHDRYKITAQTKLNIFQCNYVGLWEKWFLCRFIRYLTCER